MDAAQPTAYHSPEGHELAVEDGLMKIAIRSRFTSGRVTVRAISKGLVSGQTA